MEKVHTPLKSMNQTHICSYKKEIERGYQNEIYMKEEKTIVYPEQEEVKRVERKRKAIAIAKDMRRLGYTIKDIAKDMRRLGYTIKDIALITELPKKIIEKL
ncbi:MAG: hypothetical protein PHN72_06055 [Bacilli bacterium]|nr:hypothetical protein [Bacilli bacterium]